MKLELVEGITLEFALNKGESSPAEKMTHDYPGCAAELVFDSIIKIEPLEYLDDLEALRDSLNDIIEGKCIQEMMEKEFEETCQRDGPDSDEY